MKFFLALLASQQTLAESGVDSSCVGEEVSLLQSHHLAVKENETSWEPPTYLSVPGAPQCVVGESVSKEKCNQAVRALAPYAQPYVRRLQVGSGGSCNDGGWGQVPNGCSAQVGGDWAAHFKTGSPQPFGCVHPLYQLVCTVPQEWYLAPYGQKTCNNGGDTVSRFACDFAVHVLAEGNQKPSDALLDSNDGRYQWIMDGFIVPTGCSARTQSDWRPVFREGGHSQFASDTYQLVCTTPQS